MPPRSVCIRLRQERSSIRHDHRHIHPIRLLLRAGVVLGYVALIEGLIQRMRAELPFPVRVYATGGLAPFVASHCASIDVVDEDLTLRGLARIHSRSVREHLTTAAPAM
jgi:hypothetical protein